MTGGPQRQRLEAFTRIRDALYASGQPQIVVECPQCRQPTLDARLEVDEGRGTLYLKCKSCGLVDHTSRLELPAWATDQTSPREPPGKDVQSG